MTIRLAISDQEVAACFPIMRQLRSHLDSTQFIPTVRRQEKQGYQLAYLEDHGTIQAVAGFRRIDNLAFGGVLYVDDLVTDTDARSKGYGGQLLRWLRAHARADACNSVQLDTGVQRKDAQRFYDRQGMRLSAYHYEIAP
jgi:GNAT superfamily N-acetyltransferase